MEPGFSIGGSTTGLGNVSLSQLMQQPTPQQPQQQLRQGRQPNTFERLLPTAGGILGGLISAPFELAPGVGTAVNVAGAAGGSALGKFIENKLTGQAGGNNVLGSAVEGGIGQGAGELLSLGAKGASAALGKAAGGMRDAQAANQVAQKGVDEATQLRNAYAGVKPELQKAYRASDQTSFVKGLGLNHLNPQTLVDVSNHANDVLNSNFSDVLARSGPVDLSNYSQIIKDALAKHEGVLGSANPTVYKGGRLGTNNTDAAGLMQKLQALSTPEPLTVIDKSGNASIKVGAADANEARGLIQKLQAIAQDERPTVTAATGAIDPVQKARYDAINDIISQVKDKVYNRPEVQKGIAALQGNIRPEDVGGIPGLADHLNAVLGGSQKPQEILSEMSRFTNMNKLGKEALSGQQNISSTAAVGRAKEALPMQQNQPGITPGDIVGAIGTAAGHPLAAGAAILGHAAKSGATPSILEGVGGLLSRMSPFTKAGAQVIANAPNYVQPQGGTMPQEQGQNVNNYATAPEGDPNSLINQLITKSLLGTQAGLIGLENPYSSQGASALSSGMDALKAIAPIMQKYSAANTALQEAEQTYNQAGGGQGLFGGLLSRLGGAVTGGPAQLYQKQQEDLQSALHALGVPITAIPQLTNTPEAAQQGFSTLQQIINSMGGGGTPVLYAPGP